MNNMKTIISLILCFYFLIIVEQLNAQIGKDKYYHAGAGSAISQTTFSLVNQKTNDYKLAWRASVMLNTCAAFGKEMFDSFQTKPFSWADAGFTFVGGLITSSINRGIQARKHKREKVEYKEFYFNPPLVKK